MSVLTVNPTKVRLRLIQRCASGDTGAVQVGRVYFRAIDPAGINGERGWVSAELTTALSDDGSATIRLPNAAGPDGTQHRERFKVITQTDYRIGEEWIEIWRDGDSQPIGVVTPSTAKVGSDITLDCVDPLALLTLTREESLHAWNASPRDALDYYTRLEIPLVNTDFRGKTNAAITAAGWNLTGVATDKLGTQLDANGDTVAWGGAYTGAARNEAWTASWSIYNDFGTDGYLQFYLDTAQLINVQLEIHTGSVGSRATLILPSGGGVNFPLRKAIGSITEFRMVRRQEWIFFQVDGQLAGVARAPAVADLNPKFTILGSPSCYFRVRRFSLSVDEPFLADASSGDRHLPGAPTPGGLWARYYSEPDAKSQANGNTTKWENLQFNPRIAPTVERLEQPNFSAANPPAWMPAAIPNNYFTVRWIGSVYLDLASTDRNLRITGGSATRTRAWIGKTGPGVSPYISGLGANTGASLRTHLGTQKAGWYPIVIEADHRSGSGGVILEDRAGAGAYAAISTDNLSPYGIFSQDVQRESHRAMVEQITETFGYQWSFSPRSLESGQFPGRVVPMVRAGRDTEEVITGADALNGSTSMSAVDCADRLLLDAAGLPSKDGGAGVNVEVIADRPAGTHLFLSTAYDQASDIGDQQLLQQRGDSLLALRAGPWEQITIDPTGQRKVVDSWPLTGTLALMKWEPGDGVRLNLPEIAQVDTTPRQLTGFTWPLKPDGVGAPTATWRQRARGAKAMLERSLRTSLQSQRTYQGQLITIDGGLGANPADTSPTTPSVLMVPAGSRPIALILRIVYLSGTGQAEIEINETATGQIVKAESPIDLTSFAAPMGPTDQRIVARLINVTGLLVEIQLSAVIFR